MSTHLIASLAAIVIYSAFILYVGLGKAYSKETVSTARGYFIGGGTGYLVLYFTTMATWFSTWIFMGAPGAFFKNGIGYIAAMTWQIVILMLMGKYAPRMWRIAKEKQYITPADMLADHYQSKGLRRSVGFSQLAFIIPNLLAQISGVGLAITALTDGFIPYWAACLYAAAVVGIYVYFGGFQSQAHVDTAQGFMFFIILWGSVIILLMQPQIGGVGGLFGLMEQANENLLHYFTDNTAFWNWKTYAAYFLAQAFGGFCAPHVWQRMYAAKDGKTVVRLAGTLAPFYCFVLLLPALLIGFSGKVLGVEVANADSILVTTMGQFAPLWGIVVVIGILAAGMSTISSLLISATSIITVDFVKQAKPEMDNKDLRGVGRICVLALAVLSVIASFFNVPGIIILLNMANSGWAQAFWPLFGMLSWKRATKQGAFWGFLSGIGVVTVMYVFSLSPLGFHGGFWGFLVNGAVMFAVSLATKPMPQEQRQRTLGVLDRFRSLTETEASV